MITNYSVQKESSQIANNIKPLLTTDNLAKITSFVVENYKQKQLFYIKKIYRVVAEYLDLPDESSSNKIFTKLILLFHPDKIEKISTSFKNCCDRGDEEMILSYRYFIAVTDIVNERSSSKEIEVDDSEISNQFRNSYYDSFSEEELKSSYYEEFEYEEEDHDLLFSNSLVSDKDNIYNILLKNILSYTDCEEIDGRDMGIESLEGIEEYIYLRSIDLSSNNIFDLTPLWELQRVEALYLSHNEISEIDTLSNLKNLRIVDLSFNNISDISPLLSLPKIEYINLIGNRSISTDEIDELKSEGVIVIY